MIKVSNIQELQNAKLKYLEPFILHCERCNKDFEYNYLSRYSKREKLLCRYCSVKYAWEKKMAYDSNDISKIIQVNKPEEILEGNFKYNQLLQFNCLECGQETTVQYRNYKKEVYARLLCSPCSLKKTMNEKYGVSNATYLPDHTEKTINTLKEKYGENYQQILQQEREQGMVEKYGVPNASLCPEIQKKREETFLRKYGKSHPPRSNKYSTCELDGFEFDSAWELSFYLYWKEHNAIIKREPCYFIYRHNGKEYKYYPDFEINGTLYEIKGSQFFHIVDDQEVMYNPFCLEDNDKELSKYNCMLEHNVKIIKGQDLKELLGDIKEWDKNHNHIPGYIHIKRL